MVVGGVFKWITKGKQTDVRRKCQQVPEPEQSHWWGICKKQTTMLAPPREPDRKLCSFYNKWPRIALISSDNHSRVPRNFSWLVMSWELLFVPSWPLISEKMSRSEHTLCKTSSQWLQVQRGVRTKPGAFLQKGELRYRYPNVSDFQFQSLVQSAQMGCKAANYSPLWGRSSDFVPVHDQMETHWDGWERSRHNQTD